VTDHLPPGCRIIGTSHSAPKVVDIFDFVPDLFSNPKDTGNVVNTSTHKEGVVVFVIGAMSHGKVEVDYVEQQISFSNYPLSASVACGRLCNSFERMWNII